MSSVFFPRRYFTYTDTNCLVHNWKYFSQFYGNLNKIRQTKQFCISVLQQLQKRCCSCDGQTGESSFDLDHLQKLCQEIESLKEYQPTPISIPSNCRSTQTRK